MTIRGMLNDPIVEEVSVGYDGGTVDGELQDYDDDLGYVTVDGAKVWNPEEIDILDNSVLLRNVSVDVISPFPYSGREYASDLCENNIPKMDSEKRAPAVTLEEDEYMVLDGNSYFEAFKELGNDDSLWVNVYDYSLEEALDHFIEDHLPWRDEEVNSGEFYSDLEIKKTLENIASSDILDFSDLRDMDNKYRIEFNMERLDLDSLED
ncbi:MAG: hypothetical protein BRC29_04545 [Nanohaloarchaea archaeon SW_7_43_1]|nr:MAG: hypothetical protein BRC29_04545 [Nanohaloarchaea archaeon SW_7_43_1]